ncbi:MAG: hypothetical protein RL318_430 [Fibrobacterota bacterium]|jgi:hypothetical protein
MPNQDTFSHDQAVKNLLKAYPDEALEFLAEDAVQLHGKPISWEFLDTAVGKEDVAEPGPGQAMDLAIRYRFGDGTATILVLVEHWSDAGKLDLLRTARYFLDLMKRFPGETILPIALVDDDRPRELQDTVEHKALDFSPFRFTTRIVQVPALSLERFRHTANRVALSFTPNMAGANRLEQVLRVTVAFQEQGDTMGVRKFFAFWVVEGRLELEEQREVKRKLEEMAMPEIMEWFKQEGIEEGIEKGIERGIEQGIRTSKLEDARKMLDRGCDWAFVTDITGIKPEDLETV